MRIAFPRRNPTGQTMSFKDAQYQAGFLVNLIEATEVTFNTLRRDWRSEVPNITTPKAQFKIWADAQSSELDREFERLSETEQKAREDEFSEAFVNLGLLENQNTTYHLAVQQLAQLRPQLNPNKGRPARYAWSSVSDEMWATTPDEEIAEQLGAPQNTVRQYRSRKDKPQSPRDRGRPRKHDWSQITDDHWETFTNRELADMMGIPITTVKNHRRVYDKPQVKNRGATGLGRRTR